MEKKNINELKLEEKNLNTNLLLINQSVNNEIHTKDNKFRILSYNERGLSKSRNRAIENAIGDVCVIADDDVTYIDGYDQIIAEAFEKNKDVDIFTFQVNTPNGDKYKNYSEKKFYHNMKSVLKVSSIEIVFNRKKIINNDINFNEHFGLGAEFSSGEENIFLRECLRKGLKIMYIPEPIVIHDKESSGSLNKESVFLSKGALFKELFGWKSPLVNIYFSLKKYNEYKDKISLPKVVILLFEGSRKYKKYYKSLGE